MIISWKEKLSMFREIIFSAVITSCDFLLSSLTFLMFPAVDLDLDVDVSVFLL
jgi:hypothetical protein